MTPKPSPAARLVRAAALLVPRESREAWTREWIAELHHQRRGGADEGALALRALGAFADAWTVRSLAAEEGTEEPATVPAALRAEGRRLAATLCLGTAIALSTLGTVLAHLRPAPVPMIALAVVAGVALLAAAANAARVLSGGRTGVLAGGVLGLALAIGGALHAADAVPGLATSGGVLATWSGTWLVAAGLVRAMRRPVTPV